MLDVVMGVVSTFLQHPYLAAGIFIAIALLMIWRFSDNDLGAALVSIFKLFGSLFTYPFEFMQTSLRNFRRVDEAGAPYAGSRAHVVFKFNQLQFLFAFLVGILILAAGLTMSAIALYPKAEIDRHEAAGKVLDKAQKDLKVADAKVAEISSPDFARKAAEKRAKLTSDYQQKLGQYEAFRGTINYTSPILDEINGGYSSDEFKDVTAKTKYISDYFNDCPYGYNWNNFSDENCAELKGLVTKLYRLKLGLLEVEDALSQATYEEQNVSAALDTAKQNQAQLKKEVAQAQEEYDGSSLTKASWVKPHLKAALGILVLTIARFLALMWAYALLAHIVSWLALMMRYLERKAEKDV